MSQSLTTVPGAADPARIGEPERDTMRPQIEAIERPQQSPRADINPALVSGKKQFPFKKLKISGLTVFSVPLFEARFAHLMDTKISMRDIYTMAATLQQDYLDLGYTLTKVIVPPQQTDGAIRLKVVEGYVAEVELSETVRPSAAIKDAMAQISNMRPLNVKKLERIMLILNDMSGVQMGAVLATTKKTYVEPGAIRLVIQDTPMSDVGGTLGVNNNGTVYSGPWQVSGGARLSHIGTNYSELMLNATVARPSYELGYLGMSYEVPLFGVSGTKLRLGATGSHNQPGEDLADLDIAGRSRDYSVTLSHPLIRQRDENLRILAAFSMEHNRTSLSSERLYDDRVRVLRLGGSYAFSDRNNGFNAFDFSIERGLDILGARETGSVDLSREDGQSDFTKYRLTMARQQSITQKTEIYATLDGQFSNDVLLSGQEFGFGGSQMGRGYDSSEITGDRGVAASLEFRYNTWLSNPRLIMQPYAFYDIGKVWNIDPSARDKISAASAGFGFRTTSLNNWRTDVNISAPLTRPADNPPEYSNIDGPRVRFGVERLF